MNQTKNSQKTTIQTTTKIKEIKLYEVILLNDDITTMDFVVFILQNVFNKNEDEAIKIMYKIHNFGSAICGKYNKEIAHFKKKKVDELAKANDFPLRCSVKEEK